MTMDVIVLCKVIAWSVIGLVTMLWWIAITIVFVAMIAGGHTWEPKTARSVIATYGLIWILTTVVYGCIVVAYQLWWAYQMKIILSGGGTNGLFFPEAAMVTAALVNGVTTPLIAAKCWWHIWKHNGYEYTNGRFADKGG